MSNKPYKGFRPNWLETPAPEGSYRSIFRWGDPHFFKHPKESLYNLMKESFQMTDEDFKQYTDDIGFDPVDLSDYPSHIAPEHLAALKAIVGEAFVTTEDYPRLAVAYGCTGYDLLRLRHKQIDHLPDVVVYPDTAEQVEQIVAYAARHQIPLYVYGGGSSVTRGAGQNSTYYGTIEEIVLAQKYATPIGRVVTSPYPREATGPSMKQIMMGSEGTFGVLTEVTLRVFRWMPENRKRFSYMFKNWETAMTAAREMMQCECGHSSVFRLSDPEETHLMLRLYNVDDTPLAPLLDSFGYKDMERCMFLGFTDGEKGFSKNVAKNIGRIARKYGAMPMTGYVTKSWEKGRFNDPYLRDTLMDFSVITDTLGLDLPPEEKKFLNTRKDYR